jgi:hypothetical protein
MGENLASKLFFRDSSPLRDEKKWCLSIFEETILRIVDLTVRGLSVDTDVSA